MKNETFKKKVRSESSCQHEKNKWYFTEMLSTEIIFGYFFKNTYNLGQNAGDKFTKLSQIVFSMECFTADLL